MHDHAMTHEQAEAHRSQDTGRATGFVLAGRKADRFATCHVPQSHKEELQKRLSSGIASAIVHRTTHVTYKPARLRARYSPSLGQAPDPPSSSHPSPCACSNPARSVSTPNEDRTSTTRPQQCACAPRSRELKLAPAAAACAEQIMTALRLPALFMRRTASRTASWGPWEGTSAHAAGPGWCPASGAPRPRRSRAHTLATACAPASPGAPGRRAATSRA